MRAVNVLFGLLLVLVLVQAAAYLPRVPSPLPSHFGPTGQPDGWTDRSGMVGITLIVVALSLLVGYLVPRVITRFPRSMINLPRRDEWLAPAAVDRATRMLAVTFRVIAAATLALFLVVQQWVYATTLQGTPHIPPTASHGVVAGYTVVVLSAVVLMSLRFRRGPA